MSRSPESIIARVQNDRAKADALATRAASALITSTDSYSERVTYDGAGVPGGSPTPVTHPYLGPNSWIRVMPESMSTVIIGARAEDGESYIQAYLRDPSQNTEQKELPAVKATLDEKFYYRPLNEGEIDISSTGIANVFLSKNGNLELRGGPVSVILDSNKMETQGLAPTHMRGVYGYRRQEIVNQERFGVVQRPNSKSATSPIKDGTIWDVIKVAPAGGVAGAATAAATGNLEWAKEYLRVLKSSKGALLIDHREGNVIADDGTVMESDLTGNASRCKIQYGTTAKTKTVFDVDEEGNIGLSLPLTSTKGIIGKIPNVSASVELNIGNELKALVKNIVFDVLSSMEVTGPVCSLNTLAVNLVKDADQHLIRGEEFLNLFANHKHASSTGPTSVPLADTLLQIVPAEIALGTILSATGKVK